MGLPMVTCKKCGFSMQDDQKFCPKCGTPAGEPQAMEMEKEPQSLTFFKKKMLGNLTYKKTTTEITIVGDQITMVQTLNRLFRREKKVEKSFSTLSVTAFRSHTVLDFWDTLYTIVIGILGIFQPVLFILAAACFWCAYGKEMELTLSDGEKVKIPYAGAKEEAENLALACKR